MIKAVVGANWGDEGKGKITDMLAQEADIIVRFREEPMQDIRSSTIMENLHCIHFRLAYFITIQQALLETVLH